MRNRVEIKAEAKDIIRSARVSPLAFTAIYLIVTMVLQGIVDLVTYPPLFTSPNFLSAYYQAMTTGDMEELVRILYSVEGTMRSTFLSILISLLTTVLSAGYYIYCMGIRQGWEMRYTSLLDGFSRAGKVIWLSILMGIRIFLWSLLFFIPGIIAAYRYRFALYNVLTDDSLSAGEAIRLSCQQTNGIKFDLFVLDITFIGWALVVILTFGIAGIWVTPYMTLSDLGYFEDAQRRLGRSPYGGTPPAPEKPWEM